MSSLRCIPFLHRTVLAFIIVCLSGCLTLSDSYQRANVLFDDGRYTEAIEQYKTFVEKNPDDERVDGARASIGWCYYLLGDYNKALESLGDIQGKDANLTGWVQYIQATCYLRLGANEEAYKLFSKIVKSHADASWIASARWNEVMSLIALGRHKEAQPLLAQFIKDFPRSSSALEAEFYTILITSSERKPEEVLTDYENILKQNPSLRLESRIYSALGNLCFEGGKPTEAIADYTKALQSDAAEVISPELLYNLASAHRQLGQIEEAVIYYRRFLKEFPQHRLSLEAEAFLREQQVPEFSATGSEVRLISLLPQSIPEHTNQPSITVKGFALPQTTVFVDGEEVPLAEGVFQKDIALLVGENFIVIEAKGAEGATSEITQKIVFDNQPPQINDFDAYLDDSDYVVIEGQTEPGALLTVNQKTITLDPEGRFKDRFMKVRRPVSQELRFEVAARDPAGNVSTFEFKDTDVPDQPRNITARDITADFIVVEWRENRESDIWGYDLYYTKPGASERNQINKRIIKDNDYTIDATDIEMLRAEAVGGVIELYIRAVDRLGNESVESDHLSITLP
ncbi:MAG: tetratricopeptide repeat protein [Candidatus Omnitrophica bacterium]|nr:tetratricopeptide repeat protein [Candidatus Omnitrophota bacterium]